MSNEMDKDQNAQSVILCSESSDARGSYKVDVELIYIWRFQTSLYPNPYNLACVRSIFVFFILPIPKKVV